MQLLNTRRLKQLFTNNKAAILLPLAALLFVFRRTAKASINPVLRSVSYPSNVAAFLYMIRKCEGTATSDGYRALYGYRPGNGKTFGSYADHPRKYFPVGLKAYAGKKSSAAGAYQMLASTWDSVRKRLALSDFSPSSQDAAAVQLIKNAGAYEEVTSGRIRLACIAVKHLWASLPTSPVAQPHQTAAFVYKAFTDGGGTFVNS